MTSTKRLNLSRLLKVSLLALYAIVFSANSVKADNDYLLYEDFSKFTAGTADTPDIVDIAYWDSTTEKWAIPDAYMQEPGWTGKRVFQARGYCHLDFEENLDPGYLNTPEKSYYASQRTISVTVYARAASPYTNSTLVVAEMEGNEIKDQAEIEITTEWEPYSFEFNGTSTTNYYQISFDGLPIQIDKISIDTKRLSTPKPIAPDDYDGTSFTAKWNSVRGATFYLLTVKDSNGNSVLTDLKVTGTSYKVENLNSAESYTFTVKASDGIETTGASLECSVGPLKLLTPTTINPDDYDGASFTAKWNAVKGATYYLLTVNDSNGNSILTDLKVTETSYKVENLNGNEATTYTFTVKAFNDNLHSDPSPAQSIELGKLQDVVVDAMTNASASGFTGNWKAVPFAHGYITQLYMEQAFLEDGTFFFLNSDFSQVNTTESLPGDYYLSDYTDTYGWMLSFGELDADGKIGLNNNGGSLYSPFLRSPELDFSNDNGTATVELTASATADIEATIGFYYTNEAGRQTPVDKTKLKTFKATTTPTKQTLTIEGGAKDTYILIQPSSVETPGIIWFDDMSVAQRIAAGNAVTVAVPGGGETTDLKYAFTTPAATANRRYGYSVTAYYEKSGNETLLSNPSEIQYRDLTSGVQPIGTDADAFVSNGVLTVRNANRQTVAVFDLSGAQIAMLPDVDNATIALPHRGVYIVRIGDRALKLMN